MRGRMIRGKNSIIGVLFYILLFATALTMPREIFWINYSMFVGIVLFFVVSWLILLLYLRQNLVHDYENQMMDYYVFDLIYLWGLPIIIFLFISRTGWPIYQSIFIFYFHFISLLIFTFFRTVLFNTRHGGVMRLIVKFTFPMINLLIIDRIFNIRWIIDQAGGY